MTSNQMSLESAIGYARAVRAQHPSEITDNEEASIVLWREIERLRLAHVESERQLGGLQDQFVTQMDQIETLQVELAKERAAYSRSFEAVVEAERLRTQLRNVETVLMMVQPRSHKAEYLQCLADVRTVLDGKPVTDCSGHETAPARCCQFSDTGLHECKHCDGLWQGPVRGAAETPGDDRG